MVLTPGVSNDLFEELAGKSVMVVPWWTILSGAEEVASGTGYR